ncbi:hypothetical protein C7U54_14065 [Faecalibacillus intestinalis]|uniref:Uncharacterized protein n=1 Tax=Faecalibacillus intestinalis TaxID=1982626 RepID=A0A2T3FJY4_9FIRM|nr:hypothetical protein [Faecalibacillus intestinalis]PST35560.1 hypothetical protein C7U54_14065 [Faecalibacillus intestinalis]RGG79007.1 hypothetical protein DWW80_12870 [Coprobacillus sp. AF17-17AC]RGG83013.1 hypothetical protein DWW76_13560 [Coprobacillus sp. AF17-11AC]
MDEAIGKLGLYDFFGVLLTGLIMMIGIVGLGIYDINLFNPFGSSESIMIIIFILLSYLVGLIIKEITSIIDNKFLKYRSKATSCFLNDTVIKNKLELEAFKKMADDILGERENTKYSSTEHMYVFQHCKTYLEVNDRNEKAERINSQYAMNRSLAFISFIYAFIFLLFSQMFLVILFIFLGLMFLYQTKKCATYRVRVVLRQYRMLTMKDENNR